MSPWRITLGLASLAALVACNDGAGGVTARLVFSEEPARFALRAASVPEIVAHLEITALSVEGATLAVAHLRTDPGPGDQPLIASGGSWELQNVEAGEDRRISAKAFLAESADPRLNQALAYVGIREGIVVKAGQINDIGTLELRRAPLRIPEADFDAPSPPNPLSVLPVPEGGALRVTFSPPPDDDVAGYVLAYARTGSTARDPNIPRGTPFVAGEEIAPGVTVHTVWPFQRAEIITVGPLSDGAPYTILCYAFDADADGNPLNYSLPAKDFGTPSDITAPGAITGLTAQPSGGEIEVHFSAPSDDRGEGQVAAVGGFEVRAALLSTEIDTPAAFELRPQVLPPPTALPGVAVSFRRSTSQLGVPPGVSFYLAVRALDLSANPGPIAITQLSYNATVAPNILVVSPAVALAGREVLISGTDFGTVRGQVALDATETSTLSYPASISRWTDTEIVVQLPLSARSGNLRVVRPDTQSASAYVPVLIRRDDQLDNYEYPFEVLSHDAPGGRAAAALYAEIESGPEGAIERLFDDLNESIRYVPRLPADRATTITGVYSSSHDLYWFVADDSPSLMNAAFISSSTLSVNAFRLNGAVGAGTVDRVGVAFLKNAPGLAAGMVTFAVNGVIRTATVADVRLDRFEGFYAFSSTSAEAWDRVTIGSKSTGELMIAFRSTGASRNVLKLWQNPAGLSPNAFTPISGGTPPSVGPNIEVRAVPATLGGAEEFVIAYESIEASGRLDVRLLKASDYGTRRGLAPFTAIGTDRRLEDVGMVIRNGQVYIALLATRLAANGELGYTELPLSALDGSKADGSYPGAVLDIAPTNSRARLGCKHAPSRTCTMVWMGDTPQALFLRH